LGRPTRLPLPPEPPGSTTPTPSAIARAPGRLQATKDRAPRARLSVHTSKGDVHHEDQDPRQSRPVRRRLHPQLIEARPRALTPVVARLRPSRSSSRSPPMPSMGSRACSAKAETALGSSRNLASVPELRDAQSAPIRPRTGIGVGSSFSVGVGVGIGFRVGIGVGGSVGVWVSCRIQVSETQPSSPLGGWPLPRAATIAAWMRAVRS
jgi:hypothetical protein